MKYTSIKEIQSILKEQNIYEYSVDGICGQRTFESIVKAIEGGQFKLDFDFMHELLIVKNHVVSNDTIVLDI